MGKYIKVFVLFVIVSMIFIVISGHVLKENPSEDLMLVSMFDTVKNNERQDKFYYDSQPVKSQSE